MKLELDKNIGLEESGLCVPLDTMLQRCWSKIFARRRISS